jgi:hypothetical protein
MESQDQSLRDEWSPPPASPPSSTGRRLGCAVLSTLTFLLGIAVGIVVLLALVLFSSSERAPLPSAKPSGKEAIIVQLSKTYVTQLIERNVKSARLPGEVKNIQVTLTRDAPIAVAGDVDVSVLGFVTTRRFTLDLQPVVNDCKFSIHVLRADLEGISITSFVATFESQINSELQFGVEDLPKGFTYCAVGTRTDPQGLFITYSATPQ